MKINRHKLLLLLHDLLAIIFACFISYFYFYFSSNDGKYLNELLYCEFGIGLSTIVALFLNDNFYKYQFVLNKAKHTIGIFKLFFGSLIILIVFSFFFKIIEITQSRVFVGTIYFTFFMVFLISRVYLVPFIYYWLVKKKIVSRNMIIIGTGELSIEKVRFLNESRQSYYNIVGFLDDNSKEGEFFENIPVLGGLNDLIPVVREHKIKDILISLEDKNNLYIQNVIDFCKRTGRTVHVISELYDIIPEKIEIDEIGGISSFRLKKSSNFYNDKLKRLYDIIIALFVIVGFFPLWLLLILLIKITSNGPVFYKARVVGFNEEIFTMYKFRSMYYNTSTQTHEDYVTEIIKNNKATEKIKNDSRITPVGKILRKLSIDEFPQFINVLIGNMSIVGPRPCLPYEYEIMDKWHRKRFAVKPGISGLWQIKGRNEVKFNDQIALDLYYIENRSIKLDFEIIIKTIPVMIFGRGGR